MLGLSISAEKSDDIGDAVTTGVQNGLRDAAQAGFAASQAAVPVDSGALKASGELVERGDGAVTFRYTADYAAAVEGGTEPHPIEPDDADVLAFEVEDGTTVFTTHVDHPGTEPQPFVQPGFEAMARELRRRGLSPAIDGELGGPV